MKITIQQTATQWNNAYTNMVRSGVVAEVDRVNHFKKAVAKGKIKLGRGAYTEAQQYLATKFEDFKSQVYKEMKEKNLDGFKGGEVLNLAGDIVRPSLNMKAEKK